VSKIGETNNRRNDYSDVAKISQWRRRRNVLRRQSVPQPPVIKQRPEKLDRRWLKDGCVGRQYDTRWRRSGAETLTGLGPQKTGGIRRRDTAERSGVSICRPGRPTWTRFAPSPSASAAVLGAAWCYRTSTPNTHTIRAAELIVDYNLSIRCASWSYQPYEKCAKFLSHTVFRLFNPKSQLAKICCSAFLRQPTVEASLWENMTSKTLGEKVQYDLFRNTCSQDHCLNHIYNFNTKPTGAMRRRGHQFSLPAICLEYNKKTVHCQGIIWICMSIFNITFV